MKKIMLPLFSVMLLTLITFVLPTTTYARKSPGLRYHNVCGVAAAGHARCNAIQVDALPNGLKPNASSPTGLNPADLQAAYNLPSASAGAGQTIAIVDAYDDPNAESDLAVYRSTFGLPECSSANGCFSKVDQNGGSSYPTADAGWAVEISLDLDMVSAACPNCNILLVEANTSSLSDLATSVNTAVNLGANVVSNSYGASEDATSVLYDSYYDHPGTIITASSGDSGYGVQIPAAYNTVVAVGGTSLSRSSNSRGWTESAWSNAGSGCSSYDSKPSWQSDSDCFGRTEADVSAVADPATGVSIYDSFQQSNWLSVGGTSASAPLIAGVYGLAGNAGSLNYASSLYANTDQLFDVTSGSNGSCGGSYLCTAGPGYDGPTGLGTPNGIGAF